MAATITSKVSEIEALANRAPALQRRGKTALAGTAIDRTTDAKAAAPAGRHQLERARGLRKL